MGSDLGGDDAMEDARENMDCIHTIFEKSIRPPIERANLFIIKSRNKVINAFGIQYWVSPSCMTGFMNPSAELKGDIT